MMTYFSEHIHFARYLQYSTFMMPSPIRTMMMMTMGYGARWLVGGWLVVVVVVVVVVAAAVVVVVVVVVAAAVLQLLNLI